MQIDDPNELTLLMTSHFDEFEEFMKSDYMTHDDTLNLLKVLAKIMNCELHRGSVLKILNAVCAHRFLDTHIPHLLRKLDDENSLFTFENKILEVIKLIHTLLSNICQKVPSFSTKAFLILTVFSTLRNFVNVLASDSALQEENKQLLEECTHCCRLSRETSERNALARRGGRFGPGTNEDEELPPEDFAELSIFPGDNKMDLTDFAFLRLVQMLIIEMCVLQKIIVYKIN